MDNNTNNKENPETPLHVSKKFCVFILGQEVDKWRQRKLNNGRNRNIKVTDKTFYKCRQIKVHGNAYTKP